MPVSFVRKKDQPPAIAVVGSLITDLVVQVERAPAEGETVIGTGFGRYSGGKGANQAVAAARLGAKAVMIGRVGDDLFGRDQLASLRQSGVETSCIGLDAAAPSGVAAIVLDAAGHNRIAIVPGANNNVSPADLEAARPQIAAAHFLLVQLELPLAISLRAIEIANEVGTPVVFNPAPARALDKALFRQVALVTPNEVEAGQLTGVTVRTVADAAEAGRCLIGWGPTAAVITLGDQGALVVEATGEEIKETHIPPYQVQVVDTVAAGDAFNGALAVRLAAGDDLVAAARYANAVAAISVTRRGAQPGMPTKDEVEEFLLGR